RRGSADRRAAPNAPHSVAVGRWIRRRSHVGAVRGMVGTTWMAATRSEPGHRRRPFGIVTTEVAVHSLPVRFDQPISRARLDRGARAVVPLTAAALVPFD